MARKASKGLKKNDYPEILYVQSNRDRYEDEDFDEDYDDDCSLRTSNAPEDMLSRGLVTTRIAVYKFDRMVTVTKKIEVK